MGGFAVDISWKGRDARVVTAMMDAIGHRAAAGSAVVDFEVAALGESRLPRDGDPGWEVARRHDLTLVGDLRLWDLDPLRRLTDATGGPRDLVLAGFERLGPSVMDLVDGDFAFVIWDDRRRRLFAARDRFGVKPMWIQRTPEGVRLASEVRQLLVASDPPPDPDRVAVARYLADDTRFDARSMRTGVERLLPGHCLRLDEHSDLVLRYWDIDTIPPRRITDPAAGFRRHLIDAVARRVGSATATVSHLSGGLDSSAIAASAHLLVDDGLDPSRFATVSAIIDGADTDESPWIDAIATAQPFLHIDFRPEIGTLDDYAGDMAATDLPVAHHIRDLVARTADITLGLGADLVLTGNGGDDVANDRWILTELARRRKVSAWRRGTAATGAGSRTMTLLWAASSVGLALPQRVRRALRPRDDPTSTLAAHPVDTPDELAGSPLAVDLSDGRTLLVLEYQEALFAQRGLEVSHPFLDRRLVEFIASIPIEDRPLGPGNKELTRRAFAGLLPDSVTTRTAKTVANTYVDRVVAERSEDFERRFPHVPEAAADLVDPAAYIRAVETMERTGRVPEGLWEAWSVLLWTDAAL